LRLPRPVGSLDGAGRPSRLFPPVRGSMLGKCGLEVIDIVPVPVEVGHRERQGWPIGLAAGVTTVFARSVRRFSCRRWSLGSSVCACARKALP